MKARAALTKHDLPIHFIPRLYITNLQHSMMLSRELKEVLGRRELIGGLSKAAKAQK